MIANVRVIDGSGSPARSASVRVDGNRITAVGKLETEPADELIDGAGLVLAPGFIDAHSHHDTGIADSPQALAAVSQGITTAVVGQDGFHAWPLQQFFDALRQQPAALNFASMAGHSTLRSRVMEDDYRRPSSDAEIGAMLAMLAEELEAGALGLSSGLEYDPGSFADTRELLALAKIAAGESGVYQTHIRSEDQYFWEAVDEAVHIGRGAQVPVIISHIKLAMNSYWGQAQRLLEVLDSARDSGVDISADIYPYDAWNTSFLWLETLFPERDLNRREGAAYILNEMLSPEGILIFGHPALPRDGMTIADMAALREQDHETVLIELLKQDAATVREKGEEAGASMLGVAMHEQDIEPLMAWRHTVICSDGGLSGPHPRGFGAFARVLGYYSRQREVMPLETAVHKMTALTASKLGIRSRGLIRPGFYADLVLFDPDLVADRATAVEPLKVSAGIEQVWVNGKVVYENGAVTGALPGVPVLRQ
ncbi:MAG: D-aminoacylase [Gammaproteobacteria bacterium]|nr:D-aminoacylase [Gammaproteobacteria bacterium]